MYSIEKRNINIEQFILIGVEGGASRIEEMIYKYTSQKAFFENLLVRFTQPKFLNDPLECFSRVELTDSEAQAQHVFYRNKGAFAETIKRKRINDNPIGAAIFKRQILNEMKEKFYENGDFARSAGEIFKRKINDVVGVFSLTRNPKSLVMWAHYAGNHTGFVIGFDKEHSFFNTRRETETFGVLQSVKYVEKLRSIKLHLNSAEIPKELFFEKLADWQYEEEWRILRDCRNADANLGDVCLFKIPPEAVLEIIIGMAFPKDEIDFYIKKIKRIIPHVKFKTTRMNSMGEFEIIDLETRNR